MKPNSHWKIAPPASAQTRPRCNLLGPTALGFRHRDDVTEVTGLLDRLGIDVAVVAPLSASPADLAKLGEADFNVALYPEVALPAAQWLQRRFGQPLIKTVPIGVGATRDFIAEVAQIACIDATAVLADDRSRLPWYIALGQLDLSDRQARVHLRRRDARRRRGPHCRR